MARRKDPHEKPLTPAESRELQREVAADEYAARVRDYGEADAATYDARMAEASRLREAAAPAPPETPPVTQKEVERIVSALEKGWQAERASKPYDPAACVRPGEPKEKSRGPER